MSFAVKLLTVKGGFRNVSGSILLDETNPAASSVEAETYPALTFKSTKVEPRSSGEFRVLGDLTIRGITKPVVLDVEETGRANDLYGGTRVAYVATTRFDRTDFGLTWNQALEAGGVLVGTEVKVTLDVQAVLA